MQTQNEFMWFMAVIRRRKKLIVLPAAAVLAAVVAVAFVLPPVYRSEATILVEASNIPEELVKSGNTVYLEERLHSIAQRVLSRNNLMSVIDKHGLYPAKREKGNTEQMFEKMRKDLSYKPIQAEVATRGGRSTSMTIAFTVGFKGGDPEKVAAVTNTVTDLFLEENKRSRAESAETAYTFLENQVEDLRAQMAGSEQRIAVFKERNMLALPELLQLNLRNLNDLRRDAASRQEHINQLRDRKLILQSQLASIPPTINRPGRAETPQERYETLKMEYLAARSAHSDRHPDVVRLKNQLASMGGGGDASLRKVDELAAKKAELDAKRESYTDKHPDVQALVTEVAQLEQEVAAVATSIRRSPTFESISTEEENPALISLKGQIASIDVEIASEESLLGRQRAQLAELEERLAQSPRVEQQYNLMMRDHSNLESKYEETLQRLQAAREARGLEQSHMADRLELLDTPQVPERPVSPNRPLIVMVGVMLAGLTGLGSAAVGEYLDRSFHSARDLTRLTGRQVLGVIPYISIRAERRKRRRNRAVAAALLLLVAGAGYLALMNPEATREAVQQAMAAINTMTNRGV